jgi:hypothetical protein
MLSFPKIEYNLFASKSKLMKYATSIKPANGKILTGYTLFDLRLSHRFLDSYFASLLRLILRTYQIMIVMTTNPTSTIIDRNQIYLFIKICIITSNRLSVIGYYIVYNFKSNYDLINQMY